MSSSRHKVSVLAYARGGIIFPIAWKVQGEDPCDTFDPVLEEITNGEPLMEHWIYANALSEPPKDAAGFMMFEGLCICTVTGGYMVPEEADVAWKGVWRRAFLEDFERVNVPLPSASSRIPSPVLRLHTGEDVDGSDTKGQGVGESVRENASADHAFLVRRAAIEKFAERGGIFRF